MAPAARTAAGKDTTGAIVVSVTQDGNEVGVEVRDDGVGYEADNSALEETHVGLRIMAERAARIGATVTVRATPGHRWRRCRY